MQSDHHLCNICAESLTLMQCVKEGVICDDMLKVLKPIQYRVCNSRFSDILTCDSHVTAVHVKEKSANTHNITPKTMSVAQLKAALKERGKPVSGNKEELCRQLEGEICKEI